MNGVILGVEIFFGFVIGYALLRGAVWLWKHIRAWLKYSALFIGYFIAELCRIAVPRAKAFLKDMLKIAVIVLSALLYMVAAYYLGESHRRWAETLGDIAGIAGMLVIVTVGVILIYRILRTQPRRD